MLNHIWAFLIVAGILTGLGAAVYRTQAGEVTVTVVNGTKVTETKRYETWKEKAQAVSASGNALSREVFNMVGFDYTDAAGNKRGGAVSIAVSYIGLIAFWLGLMRLAEAAGLIALLSRLIAPLFRFIFPSIPKDHPAAGAILLNFSANILGLDNAATPLGIKAMQELQKLNGNKDRATNAMCMFLALNVSSLTLIPASVIALRGSVNSVSPASFLPVMLVATFCGTMTAFLLCKVMERRDPDNPKPGEPGSDSEIEPSEGRA